MDADMEDAASTSAEKENATAPLIANTNFALDTAITKLAKDTDFSSELDRLKTTGNEEIESATESITQAKDNSQTTATSALSLSLITVLHSLVEKGPDDVRYFYASLVLVSVCIALQILIGLITVIMYLLEHQSGKTNQQGQSSADEGGGLGGINLASYGAVAELDFSGDNQYDLKKLAQELEAAEIETAEDLLLAFRMKIKQKEFVSLLHLSALQADNKITPEVLEAAKTKLAVLKAQDLLLKVQTENIRKQRKLRTTKTLQKIISYTYYAVFVLNAFIMGLGLAG